MAQLNFDATQVAPDTGYDIVPAGWYNVAMDESEIKPTKNSDQTGDFFLQCRFNILDGQYHGRKLFARLNLKNSGPNGPQTMEIAYKQLSAIAHAVGVLHVQDSAQLHGLPLKVKVKIRKDTTGQYEDQNDITSYKNINEPVDMAGGGNAPQQGGFAPPSAPAGMGAPAGAPPAGWGAPQQPPQNWQQPVQQPPQQPVQQPQTWQQPPQEQPQQNWQQPQAQQPWAGAPQQAQQPPAQQPQQQQPPVGAPPAGAPAGGPPNAGMTPPWAQK